MVIRKAPDVHMRSPVLVERRCPRRTACSASRCCGSSRKTPPAPSSRPRPPHQQARRARPPWCGCLRHPRRAPSGPARRGSPGRRPRPASPCRQAWSPWPSWSHRCGPPAATMTPACGEACLGHTTAGVGGWICVCQRGPPTPCHAPGVRRCSVCWPSTAPCPWTSSTSASRQTCPPAAHRRGAALPSPRRSSSPPTRC